MFRCTVRKSPQLPPMRGSCEDGVYPVKQYPSSSQAQAITFAGTRASFDRWHQRLGHPSSKLYILVAVERKCSVPGGVGVAAAGCDGGRWMRESDDNNCSFLSAAVQGRWEGEGNKSMMLAVLVCLSFPPVRLASGLSSGEAGRRLLRLVEGEEDGAMVWRSLMSVFRRRLTREMRKKMVSGGWKSRAEGEIAGL
ncbi:hypothetical protein POTOM_015328 [Populus tomentosa]|uniref:GAG-pre-integrase domain-containing protein n=1 Tax=Populus tomentosa TaxID=118781 RepID=A0A8X8A1N6_POPTO|nr:hypothetical protein POTOM_015328 [Populus tomentosa]